MMRQNAGNSPITTPDSLWRQRPAPLKRSLAVIAALLLLLIFPSTLRAQDRFRDTPGHWAETAIARAVGLGLVNGNPDGSFAPDASVTRAAMVKLIVQAARLDRVFPPTVTFPDTAGHWVVTQGYLEAAIAAGLVKPTEHPTGFGPDQPIAREEIAIMAVRALGSRLDSAPELRAGDAGQITPFRRPYVAVAAAKGILSGFPDGSFRPTDPATRAQAVVIVLRLSDLLAKSSQPEGTGGAPAIQPVVGFSNQQPKTPPLVDCRPFAQHPYRIEEAFAVDPTNSNIMYVGVEFGGIYKTEDGGANWKLSDGGIPMPRRKDNPSEGCLREMGKLVIDPTNPQRLLLSRVDSPGTIKNFVTEDAGLHESLDGGGTWHQLLADWMNAGGSQALATDPKHPQTIYFGVSSLPATWSGADPTRSYVSKGILYKTTDGGKTWAELPTGLVPGIGAARVFVDKDQPNRIVLFAPAYVRQEVGGKLQAGAQLGPMVSEDGGNTWSSLSHLFPEGERSILSGTAGGPGLKHIFVAPNDSNRSYYSVDGGRTFRPTNRQYVAAYDPWDNTGNHMLSAGSKTLLESHDAGATWRSLAPVPPEVDDTSTKIAWITWDPQDRYTVYLTGTNAHVWRSRDGGLTWTAILTPEKIGLKR